MILDSRMFVAGGSGTPIKNDSDSGVDGGPVEGEADDDYEGWTELIAYQERTTWKYMVECENALSG